MEVPRLEAGSELQLLAYTTATAIQDLNRVYDLHHSSWQGRILNLLSKARDGTCILMVTNRIHFLCTTTGTPQLCAFKLQTLLLFVGKQCYFLDSFVSTVFSLGNSFSWMLNLLA